MTEFNTNKIGNQSTIKLCLFVKFSEANEILQTRTLFLLVFEELDSANPRIDQGKNLRNSWRKKKNLSSSGRG